MPTSAIKAAAIVLVARTLDFLDSVGWTVSLNQVRKAYDCQGVDPPCIDNDVVFKRWATTRFNLGG